jgi:hydroxypyruvate isomerase
MSLRLSVCVEMIFRELPFLERLERVAAAGYPAFEFWRFADKDAPAIRRKMDELGLACATFAGTGGASLVDPAARSALRDALGQALAVARQIDCRTLIVTTGQALADVPRADQHASVVAGLRELARPCEDQGVTLVLEPLNVLVDHQGYYLDRSAEAFEILDEVGSPAVKLLFDVYHQQITEGNLTSTIVANLGRIGHLHVADVPGRHEPGTGEINYRNVFRSIAAAGYEGYVGLEYRPSADAAASLAAVRALAES